MSASSTAAAADRLLAAPARADGGEVAAMPASEMPASAASAALRVSPNVSNAENEAAGDRPSHRGPRAERWPSRPPIPSRPKSSTGAVPFTMVSTPLPQP
jgi:hypothetical protein